MQRQINKVLAFVLSLAIVFGYMPAMPVYADGGIADKYTIEEIKKSQWGDDIDVEIVDDALTDGDFAEITKVVINGDDYTDKSQMRNYYGDFRISGADVVASYQKETPVSLAIIFSDGSLLATDNYVPGDNTGGDDGDDGEEETPDNGTVNDDNTLLTYADGSTLAIASIEKDANAKDINLFFTYTPNGDSPKTFDEVIASITAIKIHDKDVALKDGAYNSYFVVAADQKIAWHKPSSQEWGETAWALYHDFDNYQSHGVSVTFVGDNTLNFGETVLQDNTLSQPYQIKSVTVADLGDGKKVLISFAEPNDMMTVEDFELISQVEVDGVAAFAADKFIRAMAGRNLQSSDADLVAALDDDEEHVVVIKFVGDNDDLTYTVPAANNGGGDDDEDEEQATEEVVLSDPHQLTVAIDQVSAVKVGQGDYIKDAVKVVLDAALSTPLNPNENTTEDSYIWKYLAAPSDQNESKLVSIEIDQRDIPFKASDGLASFTFMDSSYLFTAQGNNDVAIDLYNDFIKRDKHRVKIKYTDGIIIYEDEGYVERDDLDDNTGGGNTGGGDDNTGDTGLAAKYIIESITSNFFGDAIDINFTEDMTADDFSHLVSVKVNGEVISKDKFFLKSWGAIRTEDATAIALLKDAQKENVTLIFDDGSGDDNTGGGNTGGGDDNTGGGDDNTGDTGLAAKYVIESIASNFFGDAIDINFTEDMTADDFAHLVSVKVNGEVISKDKFFLKSWGAIRTEDATAIALLKDAQKEDVTLIFDDGSGDDNTGGGDTTTAAAITISEIKKAALDTTTALGDKEVIVIVFDEDFTDDALAKLQSVEINGQTFSEVVGRSYSYANSDQLKTVLYVDNTAATAAFNDTSTGTLRVVVKFEGLEPLVYEKEVFSDADKYGFEGFAEDKSIEQLSIYEHFYTHKQMLSIKLDSSLLNADAEKVKSVQIDGETFDGLSVTVIGSEKDKFSVFSDALASKLTALQNAGQDIDELPFILTFSDDSQLARNARLQDNNKIDLNATLADGEYTLSFGAYKVGTDEQSMMRGYFDRRAKLVVQNGQKTVSFALIKFAQNAVDMALAPNGTMVSMPFQELENGEVKVYSSPIDDLTQRVELGALVDAGPLNASEGDIGNWSKYAKAEIEFRRLTAGFDEFKYAEQARIEKERSLENITEALIANGVDTDDDGVISKAELMAAQGDNLEVYTGERKNNVLDLDGYHISDISLLKDLGPGVKHLLLRNNDIEEIPANAFVNATGLETILVENNKLKRVDKDAFKGLANLKVLSMTTNGTLSSLPQGLLVGNDKLEELYLNGCSLITVGGDLLKGKTRLETLFLQENALTSLADDFFVDQSGYSLQYVRLSDNQLNGLPSSLGNAKNLSKLYAENNKIAALPDSFATLNKLKESDFSHNRLTAVPTQLLVNLSKLAQTHKYTVMVDFSDNYINQLDLDAILAVQDKGNGFRKFSFELNNLWADLSDANKEKLSKLGVDFVGYSYKFAPQKSNSELQAEGVAGKVTLTQTFDLTELYLWNDVSYNGDYLDSAAFRQYLENQYKITKKATREENLKAVLEGNGINWKVQTIIAKDGAELYNEIAAANTVEPLTQTIALAMQDGEHYVVTKVLHVKSIFGEWQPKISNRTRFVARENTEIQDGEVQEIGVKALKTGQDEPSMMGASINPIAKLKLENGKYTYTIQTDLQIANLKLSHNGQPLVLTSAQVTGDYPMAYSFTVDQKITDRVKADFKVIIMNKNQSCDLVFDYDKAPVDPNAAVTRAVDAYVLKADKSGLSMADQSLDQHKVTLISKADGTHTLKVKFNEMTMQGKTAGVDKLYVKVGNAYIAADKVATGLFSFPIPASLIRPATETSDAELMIKFEMYPIVPGHTAAVPAVLLLDWNGDFDSSQLTPDDGSGSGDDDGSGSGTDDGSGSGTDDGSGTGEGQDGEVKEIGVKALKTGQDELSMMGTAINPVAQYKLENGKYTYTIQTTMQIANFKLWYKGQPLALTSAQVTGAFPMAYSFTVDQKITGRVKADFKVIVMNANQSCDLLFDYNMAPVNPNQPVIRMINAYVLKADKSGLSMADQSLNQHKVALISKADGTHTLKVKFNEMTMQGKTAGVDKLYVKVGNAYIAADKVAKGVFTFPIPASLIRQATVADDAELMIKFEMYPIVPGHTAAVPAVLLLDWNGDFDSSQLTPGDGSGSGTDDGSGSGTDDGSGSGTDDGSGSGADNGSGSGTDDGSGSGDNQNGEVKEIGVKALKTGEDVLSMMSTAINPVAQYKLENGKYTYTIKTTMQIANLKLWYNGQPLALTSAQVTGAYPMAYSFTVDQKITNRIVAEFKVLLMNSRQSCDLLFSYGNAPINPNQPDNGSGDGSNDNDGNNGGNNGGSEQPAIPDMSTAQKVKAYILKTDKQGLSMANSSLDQNQVLFVKKDQVAYMLIKFNPMTIGEVTGGVTEFYVKVADQFVKAKAVGDGRFTAEVPVAMVKAETEQADGFIEVKFEMKPVVPGHEEPVKAFLLLDWNGDYQPAGSDQEPGDGNQNPDDGDQNPDDGNQDPGKPEDEDDKQPTQDVYGFKVGETYKAMITLLNADGSGAPSMGDFVFNNHRYAYVTRNDDDYTVVFTSGLGQFGAITGGIGNVASRDGGMYGIEQTMTTEGEFTYVSQLSFTTDELKERYLVALDILGMPGGTDVAAYLGFDFANAEKVSQTAEPDSDGDGEENVSNKNNDSTEGSTEKPKQTLKLKTIVHHSGDKATVTVDAKKLAAKVKELKQAAQDAREIVIEAQVLDGVNEVETELQQADIAAMAATENARLVIESNGMSIALEQKGLVAIANAKGKKLQVKSKKGKTGEMTFELTVDGKPVDDLAGGMTVAMQCTNCKSGQVLAVVNPDGTHTVIKKSVVGNGLAMAQLAAGATLKVIDNGKVFDDVANDSQYDSAIRFATSHELFNGTSANTFSPQAKMTRAMLVTVLHRLEGSPRAAAVQFADVAADQYYTKAVTWATKHNIVKGSNGNFDPHADITTEQLITVLYRYMGKRYMAGNKPAALNAFGDGSAVSGWARDAMQWAVGNGLISADGTLLNPQVPVTRAQVAYFMQKIVEMQLSK